MKLIVCIDFKTSAKNGYTIYTGIYSYTKELSIIILEDILFSYL